MMTGSPRLSLYKMTYPLVFRGGGVGGSPSMFSHARVSERAPTRPRERGSRAWMLASVSVTLAHYMGLALSAQTPKRAVHASSAVIID